MAPLRRESRGSIRPQISWLYYAAIEMALCGRELTIAEAALPEYDITGWFGMLAPAGTPQEA
ncbi:MAG: hypothetical protein ACREUX_06580, partial [Burkholderiales bacterium]